MYGFLRKLEMHAVHGTSGKASSPIPAVLVEERSQLETAAVCPRLSLRHDIRSEIEIDCSAPAVVRERTRIVTLVSDAQHAGRPDRGDHVRNLLHGVVKHLFERSDRDIKTADDEGSYIDATCDAIAYRSGDGATLVCSCSRYSESSQHRCFVGGGEASIER